MINVVVVHQVNINNSDTNNSKITLYLSKLWLRLIILSLTNNCIV